MGRTAMLAYRCLAAVGLVATLCAAQEAQWLELEARPELEAHMDGVPLSGPYFDCQCSLDMKCLCDKTDDFSESFLEVRDSGSGSEQPGSSGSDVSGPGSGSGSGASGSSEPEAKPEVDLDAKSGPKDEVEDKPAKGDVKNETSPGPAPHNPDLDKPRPYFIDPRKPASTAGCGKPTCLKVDVFCANKKKSACQKKGECCWKARKEMKYLRANENANYKKQRAKDFDEFAQVVAADGKLWKRIEKLDLWRERGQAREQVDEAIKLKTAEYDGKLAQLDASIAARVAEKAKLDSWKSDKISFFASRMGQLEAFEKYLEVVKDDISANRETAVKDFKANEGRMDDYLAGSESILKAREDKIAKTDAALVAATAAKTAALEEKDVELKVKEKEQAKNEKENTGPLPVTPEARDGLPAKAAPEPAKA